MTALDQGELRCPSCGSMSVNVFYEALEVPVNSVLLLDTRADALAFPQGDVELGFCEGCGFVYNVAFDPDLVEYSDRCEESQGYSPTFQRWHRQLAEDLVARHGIRRKRVLEIGCGKGEFLALMCEVGDNTGIGFDPAFVPGRTASLEDRLTFVRDFYSERYADEAGDLVCCKMTLEHIDETGAFVAMVRRAIGARRDTAVFFQVPDAERVFADAAFWDVYYEHCSYFAPGPLAALFQRQGFDVTDIRRGYGGQYLLLEARPGGGSPRVNGFAHLDDLKATIDEFAERAPRCVAAWQRKLDDWRHDGKRVVLWGSGSKAVSFLTTLGGREDIEHVVDINPHRQGYYIPGGGQRVVGPDALVEDPPDVVVVMNPIYRDEIEKDLRRRALAPQVVTT